jgi:type I restriction enzyme R subunit
MGMLGRDSVRDAVLKRDLRAAITRLNPTLPESAREEAFQKLTQVDYARSLPQHNREFYRYIRDGVPVTWREPSGETRHGHARVIDFRNGTTDGVANNRFVAVRELKLQGLRVPHYNRRADSSAL